MHTYHDIYDFLAQQTGCEREKLTPETNLRDDLGVEADDFFELMDEFARRFNVDISGYRWYFHHAEEGINVGSALFIPPYDRVTTLPVNPKLLLESANTSKWSLQYPPHRIPARRYDIVFNRLLVAALLGMGLFMLLRKLIS